jgi:hypothetical protein
MPVQAPRRVVALAVALVLASNPRAAAQDQPTGVFVGTPDGPQELGVYTSRTPVGLRLAAGTLDEVHMVQGLVRLLCNVPFWRPRSAFIATGRIFRDDRAPRRTVTLRVRQLTITAVAVVVVETEHPASLRRLLDAVGSSPDDPAYVFVTLESRGAVRDYIIGIVDDP